MRDARALPPGAVVTTTGTVTTGPEWGLQRFFQDSTAGLAAYGNALSTLTPGDSIRIRGVVSQYRGEIQLSPIFSVEVVAVGRTVIPRIADDLDDALDAGWQAMRVRFPCVGVTGCYADVREGPGRFFDRSGTYVRMDIPDALPQIGMPVGLDMHVEGVLATLDGQPVLRLADIGFNEGGDCALIAPGEVARHDDEWLAAWGAPMQSNFLAEWILPDTVIRVLTESQGGPVVARGPVASNGEIHGFRLLGWTASADTIRSPVRWFAAADPASPPAAFFFNRSLDTCFSDGSAPDGVGSSVIETDIIRRIDEAVATLDVAMYNTSRDAIVQALRRAASRGVVIRYVADSETSNGALDGPLPFPVLYREGDGIMHHKFVVGDVADAQRAWVWAGSTNFSQNQLTQDPNHAIVLRDPAIARTYTREFDEMWGALPGFQDSRTGDLKIDDTPHDFVVGDVPVSVYFSPSDETGCHILDALESADAQILAGLLLLTRDELIDALIRRHRDGLDVSVIVDDEESSEEALARLRAAGVPVRVHRFSPIFHHKYAVIDEGGNNPVVTTGSHNWTFSADRINDENVLVFRDQRTANIFRQEFEARWAELQLTATDESDEYAHLTVYPNPATDRVVVNNPSGEDCFVTVTNALGQHIGMDRVGAGQEKTILLPGMASQPIVVTWTWPFGRKSVVVNVIR